MSVKKKKKPGAAEAPATEETAVRASFVRPHWVLSWPLCAILALMSFSIVFFTVLPYVNAVGHAAFWDAGTSTMSFNYFLIPFIALDTCILTGYFKAARWAAPRIDEGCRRVWEATGAAREAGKAARAGRKAARKAEKEAAEAAA